MLIRKRLQPDVVISWQGWLIRVQLWYLLIILRFGGCHIFNRELLEGFRERKVRFLLALAVDSALSLLTLGALSSAYVRRRDHQGSGVVLLILLYLVSGHLVCKFELLLLQVLVHAGLGRPDDHVLEVHWSTLLLAAYWGVSAAVLSLGVELVAKVVKLHVTEVIFDVLACAFCSHMYDLCLKLHSWGDLAVDWIMVSVGLEA